MSKTTKNNLAYGNPGHKITPKHINGAATLQFKREQERYDKKPVRRSLRPHRHILLKTLNLKPEIV